MKSLSSTDDFLPATADHSAELTPEQPTVGIVLPVYNEIGNIRQLAADLRAQDYAAITEIWFVDGLSSDGTVEALQQIQVLDRRVRVISNPRRLPAAAINLALKSMQSDVVIRLDAHARYEPDVVTQSVQTLRATGAGGVGGIPRPAEAQTLVGRSIVAAHKSRFGVGGAKFRRGGATGWVDTIWNGCYWRHVVDRVGPLREDLWRAEDNDFNERVRRLGYGLYLSPAIRASYQTRQSFAALWTQYLGNGIGVARAVLENHRAFGVRHLLPPALVASLILPLAAALVWPPALTVAAAVLLLYLALLLAASLIAARTEPGAHLLLLPIALATLHLSDGCGALWGLLLHLQRTRILITKAKPVPN
jgi:cellulose synthase/poly-beta-1,6-N-acetylglucosamine synthase-like glycosyltransferase